MHRIARRRHQHYSIPLRLTGLLVFQYNKRLDWSAFSTVQHTCVGDVRSIEQLAAFEFSGLKARFFLIAVAGDGMLSLRFALIVVLLEESSLS